MANPGFNSKSSSENFWANTENLRARGNGESNEDEERESRGNISWILEG